MIQPSALANKLTQILNDPSISSISLTQILNDPAISRSKIDDGHQHSTKVNCQARHDQEHGSGTHCTTSRINKVVTLDYKQLNSNKDAGAQRAPQWCCAPRKANKTRLNKQLGLNAAQSKDTIHVRFNLPRSHSLRCANAPAACAATH